MGILRSLLVFLWMAVTVIPFALAIILMAPFVGPDARWWYLARPWLSGAVEAVRLVGGIQYSVEGERGCLQRRITSASFSARNTSRPGKRFFSPVACRILWPTYSNANYFTSRFFGWAMACLNMIHIDRSARGDAWSKVASMGEMLMDRGKWVIMFPEGTRSERGTQGVYKTWCRQTRDCDRREHRADCGRVSAMLAAQELYLYTRNGCRLVWPADRAVPGRKCR